NMVSLWRLDGRAEEHKPVGREALENRPEQRLRIRQVLGKHGRYDRLILSLAARAVCSQRILDGEADTIAVSRDREQTIRHGHRGRTDIDTLNLNVRALFCRQEAQDTVSCRQLQHSSVRR